MISQFYLYYESKYRSTLDPKVVLSFESSPRNLNLSSYQTKRVDEGPGG